MFTILLVFRLITHTKNRENWVFLLVEAIPNSVTCMNTIHKTYHCKISRSEAFVGMLPCCSNSELERIDNRF